MTVNERVAEEVKQYMKYIQFSYPFLFSVAAKTKIHITEKIDTAATDGKTIFVNPTFWQKLGKKQRIAVLIHEILHIGLKHVDKARRKKCHGIANIAQDIIINEFIKNSLNLPLPDNVFTASWAAKETGVSEDRIIKMSFEELYWLLMRTKGIRERMCQMKGDLIIDSEDEDEEDSDGSESEAEGKGKAKKDKETDKRDEAGKGSEDREGSDEIPTLDETAGIGPGAEHLPELVQKFKPFADWRKLLRSIIVSYGKSRIADDWTRINRKLPDVLPGKRIVPRPADVVAVVDVSGSVWPEYAIRFISELANIVRSVRTRIHAVFFDDGVRGELDIRTPADVAKAKEVVIGGGGTVIDEALRKAIDYANSHRTFRILVVFTDGYIAETSEVEDLMRRAAERFNLAIAVTIDDTLFRRSSPKWTIIKWTPD